MLKCIFWIWTIGSVALIIPWILVYMGYFPVDSRWTALGFVPPSGFIVFFLPSLVGFLIKRRWKLILGMLSIYLLFFVIFGDFALYKQKPHRFKPGADAQEISAVALNLRYYSYGFDAITDAINKIDADIYLLSENDITEEEVVRLREAIAPKVFRMGRKEGTAIISKYPVLSFREVLLPTHQASLHENNEVDDQHLNPRRSFVHAVINVNGIPVNAISIRFLAGRAKSRAPWHVLDWGFYVLESQLKELDFFLDYISDLKGPVIFGGDLNATPSSIVVRKITEKAVDAYLQDHVWGGFTFWTVTFPYARLDYLFCMNNVQPIRTRILDIVVSDHYPVYGEFKIPARSDLEQ